MQVARSIAQSSIRRLEIVNVFNYPRMIATTVAAGVVVAAIGIASAQPGVARSGVRHSAPGINRNDFARHITNPYLPYRVGSRWVYLGVKDGVSQRDVVVVTHRTRRIMGVTCTAISDVATHGGTLLEKTTDWYAQDRLGNVWYFGEA